MMVNIIRSVAAIRAVLRSLLSDLLLLPVIKPSGKFGRPWEDAYLQWMIQPAIYSACNEDRCRKETSQMNFRKLVNQPTRVSVRFRSRSLQEELRPTTFCALTEKETNVAMKEPKLARFQSHQLEARCI